MGGLLEDLRYRIALLISDNMRILKPLEKLSGPGAKYDEILKDAEEGFLKAIGKKDANKDIYENVEQHLVFVLKKPQI